MHFISGQEPVSQPTCSFDDLIKKPGAKSGEHDLDALALINLFGSHHRFGKKLKKVKENVFLARLISSLLQSPMNSL